MFFKTAEKHHRRHCRKGKKINFSRWHSRCCILFSSTIFHFVSCLLSMLLNSLSLSISHVHIVDKLTHPFDFLDIRPTCEGQSLISHSSSLFHQWIFLEFSNKIYLSSTQISSYSRINLFCWKTHEIDGIIRLELLSSITHFSYRDCG